MTDSIGFLHPGMMGISLAATVQNGGHTAVWASDGRSSATHTRATKHGLSDAGTVAALCEQSDVIVSICPPHAAEAVAEQVIACGYEGVFVDANAISPQKAGRIAQRLATAATTIDFVDGSVVGGPAWEPRRTWLYLSGQRAEQVAAYFAAGPCETALLGDEIGRASALKMCYAAFTKGSTALLTAVLGAAEKLAVRPALEQQWDWYDADATERNHQRAQRGAAKAWRFEGEMAEMAETFGEVGMGAGFFESAGDIYGRLAPFKNDQPALDALLRALTADPK